MCEMLRRRLRCLRNGGAKRIIFLGRAEEPLRRIPVLTHRPVLVPDTTRVAIVDSEHVSVELEDLGPTTGTDPMHTVYDGLLLSIGPNDPALNFARRRRRIGVGLVPGAAVSGEAEGPLRLHSWRICEGVGWRS